VQQCVRRADLGEEAGVDAGDRFCILEIAQKDTRPDDIG
jgi:hypothetical protein